MIPYIPPPMPIIIPVPTDADYSQLPQWQEIVMAVILSGCLLACFILLGYMIWDEFIREWWNRRKR